MDYLRNLPPTDCEKPVLVPGDPERLALKQVSEAQKGAIFYTANHIQTYKILAGKLNVIPMRHLE